MLPVLNLCSWIYNYVVNVCDISTVEVGVQHAVQRICELSHNVSTSKRKPVLLVYVEWCQKCSKMLVLVLKWNLQENLTGSILPASGVVNRNIIDPWKRKENRHVFRFVNLLLHTQALRVVLFLFGRFWGSDA